MGMGDVKMLAMIGAVLGWRAVIVTLVLSSCSGALVGVLMIVAGQGRHALRAAVRHVPVAGALAASLVGEPLVAWYLSFYP